MNSAHLLMCQKDMRPSVQKKWRTMAFSIVSTGNSVSTSSCEMKYEPAFKQLQGNPAVFWVRASRGPFHLSKKSQSPFHIPISEGSLLLRCLWKVGLPLQSKSGNHSIPEMIWGERNIPQAALLKLMMLYTWDGCLRESLEVPKRSQAACSVWCGSRGGYLANAREIGLISIWFWVHWAFCIPGVTSVFFSFCDSVVGDSLEFNHANRGSLRVWLGKRNCSGHNAGESGLISQGGENLMGFHELRQEPGVYSRVTAGMSIRNSSLFIEVRYLSRYEGHLRTVN